jgi:hypothetical protein
MSDKRLLEDGLQIIAQCKQQTGDIWHAHYGAAAISNSLQMNYLRLSKYTKQRRTMI